MVSGVDGEVSSELPRATRALRMLREVMHACARGGDPEELLREVCGILVDTGGFAKAWAALGTERALPAEVDWGAERDPIVRAFATRRPQAEILDGGAVPRLADAARAGARAAMALPLVADGGVFGVIEVLARDRFTADEVAALDELASNVSFTAAARRARAELRDTERHLRTLLDNVHDLIVRFDARGTLVYANPAVHQAFGTDGEHLVGQPLRALPGMPPDAARQLEESFRRVVRERRANAVEVGLDTAAGRRTYEVRHFPELDERDAVVGVIGLARDVTERKEAERALIDSERAYRSLAEHTPDYIVRWDRELRRTYANPAFARTLGRLPEQVTGSRLGEGYQPQDRAALLARATELRACVQRVFESRTPMSLEIPWIERGQQITQDLRLVPEADRSGQVTSVLGIGRDITALKRTERGLRMLADNSPDLIARIDPQGRYVFVNKAMERLTGIPAGQWIGRPVGDLLGVDSHGRRIPAFIPLVKLVESVAREPRQVDVEIAVPVGRPSATFELRVIPELDEQGFLTSMLAIGRDVTDRRALDERLRQAQKLEAVAQLAGGIAHDFNNLLVVILMQAGLAAQPGASAEVTRTALDLITETTERAAHLTNQLLAFSRRQVARMVELDLRDLVARSASLLRSVVGERIAIEVYLRGDPPPVMGDPSMIEQVLVNLAGNARDAMPAGGRLVVALEAVDVSPGQAAGPGRTAGRSVCLEVSDTGAGIDPADLPRIFEPFFTTKPLGEGTGLGLATVFGIVQQHRGWIDVESVVHHGTTFRVYFPAVERAAVAGSVAPQPPEQPADHAGGETIFLVEDDARVRSSLRAILETFGYRVLEADAPASALQIADAELEHVALLLTDLVMPGTMSALELARALAGRRPQLKVVYMTGYGAEIASKLLRVPGHIVLQKPFSPVDLARCIQRVLEEPVPR